MFAIILITLPFGERDKEVQELETGYLAMTLAPTPRSQ
jgi:hypothetical protein